MQRVKVSTGEIFSLYEISRIENVSFNPQGDPDLSFLGYERIEESSMPSVAYATVAADGVELVQGVWKTKWKVTPFSQSEIEVIQRSQAKIERQARVDAIKVTTSSGKVFDGDETSQTRMARAIVAMQATNTTSTSWVLADNTPTLVTVAELVEALALSGTAQSSVWVI